MAVSTPKGFIHVETISRVRSSLTSTFCSNRWTNNNVKIPSIRTAFLSTTVHRKRSDHSLTQQYRLQQTPSYIPRNPHTLMMRLENYKLPHHRSSLCLGRYHTAASSKAISPTPTTTEAKSTSRLFFINRWTRRIYHDIDIAIAAHNVENNDSSCNIVGTQPKLETHELCRATQPSTHNSTSKTTTTVETTQLRHTNISNASTCSSSTLLKMVKISQKKNHIQYPSPPSSKDFPDWAYKKRDFFHFEILHESSLSQARVGRIHTPHGIVDTPGFVAVATNGALKGVDFRCSDGSDVDGGANQQLIFSNTYHLIVQPGVDIIEEAGGIHKWTNRKNRPFITDSGGFQVFSLAYGSVYADLTSQKSNHQSSTMIDKSDTNENECLTATGTAAGGELKRSTNGRKKDGNGGHTMGPDAVKVSEEGVLFRSYRDGSKIFLTPESTVQAQKKIGADIIIPLDELPGYYTDLVTLQASLERTHRWEARSLQEHLRNVKQQAMYCVIHGGVNKELRTHSIEYLTSLPFDGFAIGGSLGNGKPELKSLLDFIMPQFDANEIRRSKPRHLLGIADEESIRHAIIRGIDTMDSCYPTRLARHGTVLTTTKTNQYHNPSGDGINSARSNKSNTIRLKSGTHKRSFGIPIDTNCSCSTCQHYDRSYLWHLFQANEPLAITLASQHNIHYMNDLMRRLREDIKNDLL